MDFLPISIRIRDRKILLIGGGKVASHKATILSRFTEQATVLAPEITDQIWKLPFRVIQKAYEPADLEGFQLVYICTDDAVLNSQIKREAEKRGILASVCDAPKECDFISPAIFSSGNITIAVSSDSKQVKRSMAIRDAIKELVENGILQID